MAYEKHQFLATGPREDSPQGASEPSFTAFASGWTDPGFEYGVNVQGNNCGVYGSSQHGGDRTISTGVGEIPNGVGVCGVGGSRGVFGQSWEQGGLGVHGASHRSQLRRGAVPNTGVLGEGRDVGVMGKTEEPVSVDVVPEGGAGVVGAAGLPKRGRVGGRGLVGFSEAAAQLHLHPSLLEPPKEGSAGDLLVTVAGKKDDPIATLWFCVRGDRGKRPACWRQIAFHPTEQRGECP